MRSEEPGPDWLAILLLALLALLVVLHAAERGGWPRTDSASFDTAAF